MITPKPSTECVVVAVRKRPLSSKEIASSQTSIIDIDDNMITLTQPPSARRGHRSKSRPPKSFTFDIVIDENHEQRALYDEVGGVVNTMPVTYASLPFRSLSLVTSTTSTNAASIGMQRTRAMRANTKMLARYRNAVCLGTSEFACELYMDTTNE